MQFLLDESADLPLASYLEALGHDVTSIVRNYARGLPDPVVLGIAVAERRILITNDSDFGELIVRRRLRHAGVIYFRLGREELSIKCAWLDYLLTHHEQDLGQFIVVTDHGIRIRRLR